jgi:hypothetical protein
LRAVVTIATGSIATQALAGRIVTPRRVLSPGFADSCQYGEPGFVVCVTSFHAIQLRRSK